MSRPAPEAGDYVIRGGSASRDLTNRVVHVLKGNEGRGFLAECGQRFRVAPICAATPGRFCAGCFGERIRMRLS